MCAIYGKWGCKGRRPRLYVATSNREGGMKTALITGITGQDGAYLCRLLLAKGYKVYGTRRVADERNLWRLRALGIAEHENLRVLRYDFKSSAASMLEQTEPDEIYNLAAQSFVGASFACSEETLDVTCSGALRLLEAIRRVKPATKFYQAGSSEMFGNARECPQTESTSFCPRNPYGVAKLGAHWLVVNYREKYGMFAASGIAYNHESPLRGREFVTRKITEGMAKIALGQMDCLSLGNLDALRDWGYAEEYVEAMWLMLQAGRAETLVLATGRQHSVRDFAALAAKGAGFELSWRGSGLAEEGFDAKTGKTIIRIQPEYYRENEAVPLLGNPARAQALLGWRAKTGLEELCAMMVAWDLRAWA